MKLISIVIPFYQGNKYINDTIQSVEKAIANASLDASVFEIIIINDSPDIKVLLEKEGPNVWTNKKNLGIQGARVEGIKKARGKYVLLLDQDDYLTVEAFSNLEINNDFDILIFNGIYQYANSKKLIYKNKRAQRLATNFKSYLYFRNQIVSPGQCLIKRESIPILWLSNILNENGTDDFFLWLLMFKEGKIFKINQTVAYVHKYTAENISSDTLKMLVSEQKMIEMLNELNIMSKKEISVLRKSSEYNYHKRKSPKDFIIYSFKYFGISLRNIYYLIKKA